MAPAISGYNRDLKDIKGRTFDHRISKVGKVPDASGPESESAGPRLTVLPNTIVDRD